MILFVVLAFVALNYWIKARSFLDPDFGWHLRMGEVIRAQGIPHADPFSYTMPSYPFVDHEWLTNIVFSFLYSSIGLHGMSVLFATVALCAVGLQFVFSQKKWRLLPFVLASLAFMPFLGIRPQVFSWVLFSALLVVILHGEFWKKFKWFLPLLILIWANLHGSFPLGIAVIGLKVFLISLRGVLQNKTTKQSSPQTRLPRHSTVSSDLRSNSDPEQSRTDRIGSRWSLAMTREWFIVGLCLLATFINPYGWRIWWEVWMQMTDSTLRWAIQEWLPAPFLFNLPFLVLLPISIILVAKYRHQFQPINLALYGIVLLMGLSSSRHVPFWLLLALPMTSQAFAYLYQEVTQHKEGKRRFALVYKVLTVGIIVMVGIDFFFMLPQVKYDHLARSPMKAVAFLKAHSSSGNVFNEYGVGGYLIWQYPEKKVFIDGRMPSWRWDAPKGESSNAFAEYETVMNGSPQTKEIFEKYSIDTVVLLTQEDPENVSKIFRKISPLHLVDKPKLRQQLQKMEMKEIYRDGLVVIYRVER